MQRDENRTERRQRIEAMTNAGAIGRRTRPWDSGQTSHLHLSARQRLAALHRRSHPYRAHR